MSDTARPFSAAAVAVPFAVGVITILLSRFDGGDLPPLRWSVVALFALFAIGMWRVRLSSFSLLSKMGLLFYVVPFAPTLGYLFFEPFYWWPTREAVALQGQPRNLEIMLAVGLVGLSGLLTGLIAAHAGRRARARAEVTGLPVLGTTGYLLGLSTAFGLSWLSMPKETILVSRYAVGQSPSRAVALHFNSAYLIAYILLVLLLVDADWDVSHAGRRRAKVLLWLAVTAFIVVVHQVLRGDRECAGLLIAALAYFVTGARAPGALRIRQQRRRLLSAAAIGTAAATVFVGLQVTRTNPDHRAMLSPKTLVQGVAYGTWTAVLLADLSLANKIREGHVESAGGRTYGEYLLSLPPGFIADVIGWERPLEETRGPAYLFTDVSGGGCHLPIVPFLNFGWWGVFLVLALYGWVLGRVDRWADAPQRVRRFAYAATFTFLPFWFWYGDMYAIRGVMIIGLCWAGYRMAVFLRSRRFLPGT